MQWASGLQLPPSGLTNFTRTIQNISYSYFNNLLIHNFLKRSLFNYLPFSHPAPGRTRYSFFFLLPKLSYHSTANSSLNFILLDRYLFIHLSVSIRSCNLWGRSFVSFSFVYLANSIQGGCLKFVWPVLNVSKHVIELKMWLILIQFSL